MDASDDGDEPDFGQLFAGGVGPVEAAGAILPAAGSGAIVPAVSSGGIVLAGAILLPAAAGAIVPAAGSGGLLPAAKAKRKHRRTHGLCGAPGQRTAEQKTAVAKAGADARLKSSFHRQRDVLAKAEARASKAQEVFARCTAALMSAYLPHTTTSLSLALSVSAGHVRACQQCVAHVWLERQIIALRMVLLMCGAGIDLWFERLEFDETKQVLSLDAHEHLLHHQQRCSWPVLVAVLIVGWTMKGCDEIFEFPLVRAPVICIGSVNASCLYDAVFDQHQFRPVLDMLKQLRSRASRVILVREVDSARSGFKAIVGELAAIRMSGESYAATLLHFVSCCFLHQVNMIARELVQPDEAGLKMLKGWHAYTLVCKTGNYFIRMVLAVMPLVNQILIRTFSPPNSDPEFLAARTLILDFLWPCTRVNRRRSDRNPRATAAHAKRAMRIQKLRAEWDLMINAELFTDRLVHCCSPFRCNCKSRIDAVHRISKLLVRTIFFERPRKPELKEWSAIGRCLQNTSFGLAPGMALKKIFAVAVLEMPPGESLSLDPHAPLTLAAVPGSSRAQNTESGPVTETQKFFRQMDWAELTGRRIADAKLLLTDPDLVFRTLLYAILICTVEMASSFLTSATTSSKPLASDPPLFDLMNPLYSVVRMALQLFSALLCDGTPLLYFVYSCAGASYFASLHASSAQLAQELRCGVIRVAASLWLRLQFKLLQPQWSVLSVADSRRADAERQEDAQRFYDTNEHDLDPGFARSLRHSLTCVADLFLPVIQQILLLVARLVRGHTQASEDRHASHRKMITSSSDWYGFCARAVNMEAERACPPSLQSRKRERSTPPRSSNSKPGPVKGVLIRYNHYRLQRDGRNVDMSSAWQRTREEWDSLLPEAKARFVAMHEAQLEAEVLHRRTRTESGGHAEILAATQNISVLPKIGGHAETPQASRGCRMEELRLDGPASTMAQRVLTSPLRKECLDQMLQHLGLSIKSAAASFRSTLLHGLAKDRGKAIAATIYKPCFGVCCRESSDAAKLTRACCLRLEGLMNKALVSAGKLYGGSRRLLQDLKKLFLWEVTFPSGEISSVAAMPVQIVAPNVVGIPKKSILLLMVHLQPRDRRDSSFTGRDGRLARTRYVQPVRPIQRLCNGVLVGGLDFRVSPELFPDLLAVMPSTIRFASLAFRWSDRHADVVLIDGIELELGAITTADVLKRRQPQRRRRADGAEPDFASLFKPIARSRPGAGNERNYNEHGDLQDEPVEDPVSDGNLSVNSVESDLAGADVEPALDAAADPEFGHSGSSSDSGSSKSASSSSSFSTPSAPAPASSS